MPAIYPVLPGLAFDVTKEPSFNTKIQKSVSGRVLKLTYQPSPLWSWTLTYSILRDGRSNNQMAPAAGYDELRTLGGFFLAQQGSFGTFLFDDPTDDYVIGQLIGTGDGSTTQFQLVRTWGAAAAVGFAEPILAPNIVETIYFNGIPYDPPSICSVNLNSGILTFESAPAPGAIITADFSYYFRVRFDADNLSFNNFLYQLWEAKEVKLKSELL